MNEGYIWLLTGFEHVLNPGGYDHILFVALLTLAYPPQNWKRLLLIITAFTVGHSVSLAVSVLSGLEIFQPAVEFMIALTILATAVFQIADSGERNADKWLFVYLVTIFFGMIHGLGFSLQLRSLLGTEESVFLPLVYFNLGLEAAQLVVVAAVWLFSLLLSRLINRPHRVHKLTFACIIALIAAIITAERLRELLHYS
jgi:hypothetical protein